MTLPEMLVKLCTIYKFDPSAASIVLSYLPNGMYYGSACRYRAKFGQEKVVICKSIQATLDAVLVELEEGLHREVFSRFTAPVGEPTKQLEVKEEVKLIEGATAEVVKSEPEKKEGE
jgi:hypothetical protein